MLKQADWAAFIPHADDMCLLDAVHDWSFATIHATGERHASSDHPLRSQRGLHAVHLAEYGAQATAVHGALLAISQGDAKTKPGRLVSVRDMHLMVEYVELSKGRLDVHAECLAADAQGAHYQFKVEQNTQLLASGRVLVMHTDA